MTSTNVPGGAGPPKADLTSDDYKHTINQACVLAIADLESSDTSMLCGLSCLYDRLNHTGMQTFVNTYRHKINYAHGRNITELSPHRCMGPGSQSRRAPARNASHQPPAPTAAAGKRETTRYQVLM